MNGQAAKATLLLCDGGSVPLPALRKWEILRTDGESCDAVSFETDCCLSPAQLQKADRLQVTLGGQTVFSGVVDECELELSGRGSGLCVYGRGFGARLLDNQTPAYSFLRLSAAELVRRFVAPCGVTAGAIPNVSVANFSVACGSSVMQTVKGFCAHAGLLPPMFDAQGCLLLRRQRPAGTVSGAVRAARYCDRRYGVITRQTLTHSRTGAKQTAGYPALIARGGRCERYGMFSGDTLPASFRTARQRIDDAREGEYTASLTVADQWPCEPGVRTALSVPKLALDGQWCVRQVRSVGSEDGCYAEVSLFRCE